MSDKTPYRHATTYAEVQREYEIVERQVQQRREIELGLTRVDAYLNRPFLDGLNRAKVQPYDGTRDDVNRLRIIQLTKVVYNPDEPIQEKLMSVCNAIYNMGGTLATFICSEPDGVRFYIAVRADARESLSEAVLSESLKGNFPGLCARNLNLSEKKTLLGRFNKDGRAPKSLASLNFIPSSRAEDADDFVQGIEKFIEAMAGQSYTVALLAEPLNRMELERRRHMLESIYSAMSAQSKISVSYASSHSLSINESISSSFTKTVNDSISDTTGRNQTYSSGSNSSDSSGMNFSGEGWGANFGSSSGSFSSYSSGSSFSNTVTKGIGAARGYVSGDGKAETDTSTETETLNFENKGITELMERIDRHMERIAESETYGMWQFSAYFLSDNIAATVSAATLYQSIMLGTDSCVENVHMNLWTESEAWEIKQITDHIKHLRHPVFEIEPVMDYQETLVKPCSMISGREAGIIFGFPRHSVCGLPVIEMASFGRSVVYENIQYVKRTMEIGNVYHMGSVTPQRGTMDLDLLSSHCFITGSSGSGKSNATYVLLDQLIKQNVNLLIVEPAKGEYKQVFGGLPGVRIYTTDPDVYSLLRLNPFRFPKGGNVLSHIEKLNQVFQAAWPMYAAMPAMMKEAVEQCYLRCGWDVNHSIWIEGVCDHQYPTFADLQQALTKLIDDSDYSAESKGNYKGALITRVHSMTTGIAGMIFADSNGIADEDLFDSNTVVDLSDIGSDETIALLMGMLIMKLGEHHVAQRKIDNSQNVGLRHVTVLEEAHNILKRTNKEQSQESSNLIGKSVEMISNSIREMRTYGEGFVIIDQSPTAVDVSAIENTATKIYMNTSSQEACEELASSLSLSDEQRAEISRLNVGVAVVYQKGWLEPVLLKIDEWDNQYEAEVHRADRSAILRLRGQLVAEYLRQFEARRFEPMKINRLIKDSEVLDEKKRIYRELNQQVNSHFVVPKARFTYSLTASVLAQLLDCGALFDIIEPTDLPDVTKYTHTISKFDSSQKSDRYMANVNQRCEQWKARFAKALNQYAVFEDARHTDKVIRALLWNKTKNATKDSPFLLLYRLIESGRVH